MRSDEAAKIIEKEKRCVFTDCERPECKNCGLVMDTGEILEALDMAISALEKQIPRAEWYKEGMQLSIDDAKLKKEYQRGLNDAWDAARKISTMDSTTRDKIFKKVITTSIIEGNTASEAIEKIRQYEQEKEEQIQVGDEVIGILSSGEHTKPFVITKWNSDYYFGIYSDSGEFCQGGLKLQKTGRHFPEIAKVLKRMKEETA